MERRSYNMYCSIAKALDLIGERWTLLLIRELLTGPKRFTDLLDGLQGIGTNLLSRRLKDLEADGVIEQKNLPAPAASRVYDLTKYGQELKPILISLGRWGLKSMGLPHARENWRVSWLILAMQITFRPELAIGIQETYELRVDEEIFHLTVDNGDINAIQGPSNNPDLVLSTDGETLFSIATFQLNMEDAIGDGRVIIDGDQEALERMITYFQMPEPIMADPKG